MDCSVRLPSLHVGLGTCIILVFWRLPFHLFLTSVPARFKACTKWVEGKCLLSASRVFSGTCRGEDRFGCVEAGPRLFLGLLKGLRTDFNVASEDWGLVLKHLQVPVLQISIMHEGG